MKGGNDSPTADDVRRIIGSGISFPLALGLSLSPLVCGVSFAPSLSSGEGIDVLELEVDKGVNPEIVRSVLIGRANFPCLAAKTADKTSTKPYGHRTMVAPSLPTSSVNPVVGLAFLKCKRHCANNERTNIGEGMTGMTMTEEAAVGGETRGNAATIQPTVGSSNDYGVQVQ
ncbi:hypothetical protein K2173_025961 [Erythroxylum novogranatense]|uniref:Uncharacterized protein n=1 Tax=Erythroxylum novogranatense TaxID=1862640 RepID=A0AAV8TYU8_9ROSI|nr:hypothetical protein K2173_025961 [Erythroxylum novogranatense]